MATKARIENGRVAEILTADPFPPFHPDLVWVDCPADVQAGHGYDGAVFTAPLPDPPAVPDAVDMAQARLALLQSGLLAQVDAAIAALPEPQLSAARIEWEFRPRVTRDSPLVQQLSLALGLSDQQVDALFVLAASL